MLLDCHCHLHDPDFFTESQQEDFLKNARSQGVGQIICIGTSHEDSLKARDFAESHDDVFWTYGIHPEEADKANKRNCLGGWPDNLFAQHFSETYGSPRASGVAKTLVSETASEASAEREAALARKDGPRERRVAETNVSTGPRDNSPETTEQGNRSKNPHSSSLVAIGEIGLDYHSDGYDRNAQIRLFEEMLSLATDLDLPVSFHVRNAFPDFFAIVANFPKIRGVVHSFTDSKQTLKRILDTTDFYVGVNGLATYSTLPTPPLDRIILETDAPFLTPIPFRGIINQPAYIRNIAEWLSNKLGVSLEEVERITTKNGRELFNLPHPVSESRRDC